MVKIGLGLWSCCTTSGPTTGCVNCNEGISAVQYDFRLDGFTMVPTLPNTTYRLTTSTCTGTTVYYPPGSPPYNWQLSYGIGPGGTFGFLITKWGGLEGHDFQSVPASGNCLFSGEIEIDWRASSDNFGNDVTPKPSKLGQVYVSRVT